VKAHYSGIFWTKKCTHFFIHLLLFWGQFFSSHLTFWETLKMDFWHKSSSTILVIFQMIVVFQKNFYAFKHACLNEKPHIELKWDNKLICNIWLNTSSNLLIVWMIFEYICILQYIRTIYIFFNNIFFNHLISTSKWDFFYNFFFGFEIHCSKYYLQKIILILIC
jgi:hypothetical protein